MIRLLIVSLVVLLSACGTAPRPAQVEVPPPVRLPSAADTRGNELALYAVGLIDTGYRFGGKNPEAGLDCSGMVSYIFAQALGVRFNGSAAEMARRGSAVDRQQLRPGDLVFFNTQKRSFSHVGVYIGDDRFVHAPSSNGRVRIDQMGAKYYAQRYESARAYFD